jgi:hypothetical protein
LTQRRLQVAEVEARREIAYFGKREPLVGEEHSLSEPVETQAVTREQIEQALNDENGSYRRLRRVMDAWNALWFWPLTERATGGVQPPSFEQWLSGLEGILGIQASAGQAPRRFGHTQGQTSVLSMASWGELEAIESFDLSTSQVKPIDTVRTLHPWLDVCERVAADQGFFHWELDFASVFGRGGFDLQVGNPPWVRPRSDEAALLAEGDPWWQLTDKPTQTEEKAKRIETLARTGIRELFVDGFVPTNVVAQFLGSTANYLLLAGLQVDLYRAFMVRTWRSVSKTGTVALVHPESHFTEKKASHLRAETYRRLRRHWQFINELTLFEIDHHVTFGVHVYGARRESPRFKMAASLYHPETVVRSEGHHGLGEVPGLKDSEGNWDTRPHSERIIDVDETLLGVWADILDAPGTPANQARMVYPVNRTASNVLLKLATHKRLLDLRPRFSTGWHETNARRDGQFEVGYGSPKNWTGVIVQGPHFGNLLPFAKVPNPTMKNNLDWSEVDLAAIGVNWLPSTTYKVSNDPEAFRKSYGEWGPAESRTSAADGFRIFWREYVGSVTGKRTLQAAIFPPGTTHINAVNSMGLDGDDRTLLVVAGFLNSMLLDFWVRTAGSSHIYSGSLSRLPYDCTPMIAEQIARRVVAAHSLGEHYTALVRALTEPAATSPSLLTDYERQSLLPEIDALVALQFGVPVDDLCTLYRTQFAVLADQDRQVLFDQSGRRIPGDMNRLYRKIGGNLTVEERTWTHPQSGVEYVSEFPFQGFDREEEMRKAYARFSSMLGEKA